MYIAVMNELHDSLDEMKRENLRLQEEVATLKLLVAKLQQMLFGRKSERLTGEDAGQMVMARAIEIAISDGRLVIDLSAHDWQQAKRELTGEPDEIS